MDGANFREFASEMANYITNYLDNIRDRRVIPDVKPGYLRKLLPETAPEKSEKWTDVMKDVENIIMPGVTHWLSPKFLAYYPSAHSYPAIVADMLSDALSCIGFTWIACPACTELEMITLDWLGKMMNIPSVFLSSSDGNGGGVLQASASEATLVALLAAKSKALTQVKTSNKNLKDGDIIPNLIGYTSELAHSSVERAALLSDVKIRFLKVDKNGSLKGETLLEAIEQDLKDGLIPFFTVATLGTTAMCSFDELDVIGDVCNEKGIWLHVDASYAGGAFICSEFRYLMKGIEKVDSFNISAYKLLMMNFDGAPMWIKEPSWFSNAFKVDPLYLRDDMNCSIPEYRNWEIPLARRFRSLKLWFVLRLQGVNYLQENIRKQFAMAAYFKDLCDSDSRFEIIGKVIMGLVCFRLKGNNHINETLNNMLTERGKIYLVLSKLDDVLFMRMVTSSSCERKDIEFAWNEIVECTNSIISTN